MKSIRIIALVTAALVTAAVNPAYAGSDSEEIRQERVSFKDLNINEEAGARKLLSRIQSAARRVCQESRFADTAREYRECREETVKNAVAKVNRPMLTAALSGKPQETQLASR